MKETHAKIAPFGAYLEYPKSPGITQVCLLELGIIERSKALSGRKALLSDSLNQRQ